MWNLISSSVLRTSATAAARLPAARSAAAGFVVRQPSSTAFSCLELAVSRRLGSNRNAVVAGAFAGVAAAIVAGTAGSSPSKAEAAPGPGRLAGAVVIVTGGGGDFGRTGAALFKREGAHVVLWDASKQALEAAEKALQAVPGPSVLVTQCDVTSDAQVEAAVQAAEKSFGKITHLWNNAGYQGLVKPTLEYPTSDFQRVQDINVVGAFRVMQAVSKSMQKSGGGVIVNTASVAGLRGTPAMPAYVASKAAVLALTMSVAKDLAPYNIRVNAVSPALIGPGFMWDRQNELHASSGSPYFARDAETVGKNKIAGVPMKRLGSIDEVVKSVLFLLSDESSYCTGTNLVVDGGLQMR
eukprot:TRINITY_DN14327_c0_g2_i2.p1 TRINITY_DN14327_c0_g2~~TRINITY_DN14327_c0_g2_i2.p1  ORF type:complete len:354 (-),score=76.01 TRINITY_DN14327_c0_g2_i2:158-1219(-)